MGNTVFNYAIQPPRLECLICGASRTLVLPVNVDVFCEEASVFEAEHANCSENPKEALDVRHGS